MAAKRYRRLEKALSEQTQRNISTLQRMLSIPGLQLIYPGPYACSNATMDIVNSEIGVVNFETMTPMRAYRNDAVYRADHQISLIRTCLICRLLWVAETGDAPESGGPGARRPACSGNAVLQAWNGHAGPVIFKVLRPLYRLSRRRPQRKSCVASSYSPVGTRGRICPFPRGDPRARCSPQDMHSLSILSCIVVPDYPRVRASRFQNDLGRGTLPVCS